MRRLLFLILTLISFSFYSQEDDYVNDNVLRYDDYLYKPNIKTVQIYESNWEGSPPILNLNSQEQLVLEFDDLEGDKKQYAISFIHCNYDWTPSDLMVTEYINGFADLNIINFNFSVNTIQKYTHYNVKFPTQNIQFTKSGNYIVYVYNTNDKKDIVLSRRFMVYDSQVTITSTIRQSTSGDEQFSKQQIDFTIYPGNYNVTNPFVDLKVVVAQNNRFDNAVTSIKPTFIGNNNFNYSLDPATNFNGGNEFRHFDLRSLRFVTENVKEIYRDQEYKNHATLNPEKNRRVTPYVFYNDLNGGFLIKNTNALGNVNTDTDADYVYVDFFLPYQTPEAKGNFYVIGKLTDWRMNKNSKLTYNPQRFGYELQLYLKQGYYNYMYVLSNDKNNSGDETLTEGNHWDTENDYYFYIYHRKIGTYYDALIGYKKFNSLKK
ncbi:MAG: DUF5103 domain-containing protein [Bacteroidetes bacterium]|nr:DUF5103 domain-containing protein [Bacteroidota bacterium]